MYYYTCNNTCIYDFSTCINVNVLLHMYIIHVYMILVHV